jgi:hypothetical protein
MTFPDWADSSQKRYGWQTRERAKRVDSRPVLWLKTP